MDRFVLIGCIVFYGWVLAFGWVGWHNGFLDGPFVIAADVVVLVAMVVIAWLWKRRLSRP